MNSAPATASLRHHSAHSEIFEAAATAGISAGSRLIKRPLEVLCNDPVRTIALENEYRILCALHDSVAPQCFAAQLHGNAPWLLMEAIPGTTVAEVLARYAADPGERRTAEIAQIGQAMALAVHHLHRQGAVHHNLQPQHIVLREGGAATLLDFSMAWYAYFPDLLAPAPRAETADPAGNAMPQGGGRRGDRRADITALGRILYALCTGHLPVNANPVPPRATHADTTPAWLQEIIMRCLDHRPQSGYTSAALLAFDLRFPGQVQVGGRGLRTHPLNAWAQWTQSALETVSRQRAQRHAAQRPAPLVMAVVPSSETSTQRLTALRRATQSALGGHPDARLLCVNTHPASLDDTVQRSQTIQLEIWAAALLNGAAQPPGIAYQAITSGQAARSLIDLAKQLAVDHLLIDAEDAQSLFAEADLLRTALPFTLTLVHADARL